MVREPHQKFHRLCEERSAFDFSPSIREFFSSLSSLTFGTFPVLVHTPCTTPRSCAKLSRFRFCYPLCSSFLFISFSFSSFQESFLCLLLPRRTPGSLPFLCLPGGKLGLRSLLPRSSTPKPMRENGYRNAFPTSRSWPLATSCSKLSCPRTRDVNELPIVECGSESERDEQERTKLVVIANSFLLSQVPSHVRILHTVVSV